LLKSRGFEFARARDGAVRVPIRIVALMPCPAGPALAAAPVPDAASGDWRRRRGSGAMGLARPPDAAGARGNAAIACLTALAGVHGVWARMP